MLLRRIRILELKSRTTHAPRSTPSAWSAISWRLVASYDTDLKVFCTDICYKTLLQGILGTCVLDALKRHFLGAQLECSDTGRSLNMP